MLDMPSATSSPMVDPTTPIPEIRFSVGEFRDALGVAPKGKPTDGPAAKADVDAPSVPKVSPKETTLLEEQYSVQSESSSSSSLPEKAVRGSGQVQYIIDENLMKRIRSPIRTDSSVYIFTSFSGNTVKIGRDLDPIRHVQEIRGECQCQAFAGQGTLSFPNVKRNFERAINLVYLELENFRTKISCQNQQHGSSCGFENEHRKWFDVPESVALNSVKLWGDFVEEAYTDRGFLRGDWEKRLTLLPKPGETEILSLRAGDTTTHHRLRNARYRDWFNSKRSQQSV
ncbi:hypothetical protein B0J14DRAFT_89061 [Halenospora varia]|nr:hypothetical protein B0J14DRAFT_89061 [Halenospora varia]